MLCLINHLLFFFKKKVTPSDSDWSSCFLDTWPNAQKNHKSNQYCVATQKYLTKCTKKLKTYLALMRADSAKKSIVTNMSDIKNVQMH